MHIPYGFLDDPATLIATNAAAATGSAWAYRRMHSTMNTRTTPLLGSAAAFIFAAQMVNFKVAAGTSGHLLGGVLAAVLLGPWGAIVAMTVILVVQCLLFADGGLLELGANVLNMAIVGGGGGWCVYRLIRQAMRNDAGILVGTIVASWLSVVAAAACCSIELAAAGSARLGPALAAMIGVHSVIGIGEAAISGLIVAVLLKSRRDLIFGESPKASSRRVEFWPTLLGGAVMAFVVAVFLAPVASDLPDGLEAVAQKLGFAEKEREAGLLPTPVPDYEIPGLSSLALARSAAGALGVGAVAFLAVALGRGAGREEPDLKSMAG